MRTFRPGNKLWRAEEGSVLVDAVVTMLIISTLGLAILMLLVRSFQGLYSYDTEVRSCLQQIVQDEPKQP